MLYCPYCGTKILDDENYCTSCGEEYPKDIYNRPNMKKRLNRFWYIPIALTILLLCVALSDYFILQHKQSEAMNYYELGEEQISDQMYQQAEESFNKSLQYKSNLQESIVALSFTKNAITIMDDFSKIQSLLDKENYQEATKLINNAEHSLKNFQGDSVTYLVNEIVRLQDEIKVSELKSELILNPNIDTLKTLLWEAESINNDEGERISEQIRHQIIDFTFSKASEQLNNKQFNDAQLIIEDGLKYVPDSDKLQSLNTTIEKEKTAFETAQLNRIELAINLAEQEEEINKNDAIKLDNVKVEIGDQDEVVVKGEVSSVATIPVTSILVEYSLIDNKDKEILTNKVFVYPDKVYPGEAGKFEFTHYDMKNNKDIDIHVNKIRWYTD